MPTICTQELVRAVPKVEVHEIIKEVPKIEYQAPFLARNASISLPRRCRSGSWRCPRPWKGLSMAKKA